MVQNKATWVTRFVVMECHLHVPSVYIMKDAFPVATFQTQIILYDGSLVQEFAHLHSYPMSVPVADTGKGPSRVLAGC